MQATNQKRLGWILLGVLIGFVLTVVMPAQPLHAVATHGADGFALATCMVDSGIEGVFFLDGLTGDLRGAVLNVASGKFTTLFERNILQDLQVDLTKSPKFLMVTGIAGLRRGATQLQPAQSVIYVTECNSGMCVCYGMGYMQGRTNQANQGLQQGTFAVLDTLKFRTVALRQQ